MKEIRFELADDICDSLSKLAKLRHLDVNDLIFYIISSFVSKHKDISKKVDNKNENTTSYIVKERDLPNYLNLF